MSEATPGPDDDGATLVALALPSGTGYAAREPQSGGSEPLLTQHGRLLAFTSPDAVARHLGGLPGRVESHDLVAVADTLGASHDVRGPESEDAVRLLLELDAALDAGFSQLVGPGTA